MFLKLEDIKTGQKVCVNSASIKCFYQKGKEGTVVWFELLDDEQKQRGFIIKAKESFHYIFEAMRACGEAV